MDEIEEEQLHVVRVAAVDVGKGALEVCIRVPSETSTPRRAQEVRGFGATKRQILSLADWLRSHRVRKVVMEATGDYWKAPFFRLEAEGFDCELLDARQVKALPGRPKTDRADCVWLAKVAERGMVSHCFVPAAQFNGVRAPGGDDGSVDWSMHPSGCLVGARISSLHPPFDRASLKHILGTLRDHRAQAA